MVFTANWFWREIPWSAAFSAAVLKEKKRFSPPFRGNSLLPIFNELHHQATQTRHEPKKSLESITSAQSRAGLATERIIRRSGTYRTYVPGEYLGGRRMPSENEWRCLPCRPNDNSRMNIFLTIAERKIQEAIANGILRTFRVPADRLTRIRIRGFPRISGWHTGF
jgi:hypothetical protein